MARLCVLVVSAATALTLSGCSLIPGLGEETEPAPGDRTTLLLEAGEIPESGFAQTDESVNGEAPGGRLGVANATICEGELAPYVAKYAGDSAFRTFEQDGLSPAEPNTFTTGIFITDDASSVVDRLREDLQDCSEPGDANAAQVRPFDPDLGSIDSVCFQARVVEGRFATDMPACVSGEGDRLVLNFLVGFSDTTTSELGTPVVDMAPLVMKAAVDKAYA